MADSDGARPLLSAVHGGDSLNNKENHSKAPKLDTVNHSEEDMKAINGVTDLVREIYIESKKLLYIAGPAIFTSFCQYGLITITQIFAGHLGNIQLAAISVENSIISGFPFGMMYGLSSVLETYCGQAYGANQHEMLGIYMQRSWIILFAMAFITLPFFIFATPILRLLGQTQSISREAGKIALWMIPQQFAYALMLPSTKFLQAQTKVVAIAVIAGVALCLHAFFNWVFVANLGWGLEGAALVLDGSWWFIGVAQLLYIVAGFCGESWVGFSWKSFNEMWGFFKVSVASAVMMCLEVWYMMSLTLFAGYLEDAEISIDAFSICLNILGWATTVALGLNVASSVRVSNELGSRHPRKARFSVIVIGVSSLLVGLLFTLILVMTRNQYPAIFSNSPQVQQLVEKLTPLLGISMVFTNVQYALSGVAIGAGWQVPVAYMSTGCYFIFGVPSGVLMAFVFNMGIEGIWYGMLIGLCLQTSLLLWMISITDWNKEAYAAEERLEKWKGQAGDEGGY